MLPADDEIAPGIRRVLAPNPSPLTGTGTNSYLVGSGAVAVIDPGPAIVSHLDALLAALRPGERISHIFVTHAHLDHSALAPALAQRTGAPVLAFGGATEGRSPVMVKLASHLTSGGEGLDPGFRPDLRIGDGEAISGETWTLKVLHTPGHLGGHLCFAMGDALFTGDHVMGWSSTVVSPPDGDMSAYMASLARLLTVPACRLYPGHGPVITDPRTRLADLIAHRHDREAQILAALDASPLPLMDLCAKVYHDIPAALLRAAERNTLAHLIDLECRNLVVSIRLPGFEASYRRA